MALIILNGPIIEAGESLSDAIDLTDGRLLRVTMPTEWTAVPLTFQVSSDGVFFNDLVRIDGSEITMTVVPGSGVIFPVDVIYSLAFLKFRSGTRDSPVPQETRRQFAVAIDGKLKTEVKAKGKTPAKKAKKKGKR